MSGEPVVLKWGIDPDLEEKIPYVSGLFHTLSDRGCRIPRIIAHGPLGGRAGSPDWLGYAWVQERIPGSAATVIDNALLGDLLALIDRLAGAPPGAHRNDLGAWVPLVVLDDEAGYWHNARAIGTDAERFCRRLRAWVGRPDLATYPEHGAGYVHCDLNLNNILVLDRRLSGLVDIEHMGVGDRAVDIARLACEWHMLARAGAAGLAIDGLRRLADVGLEIGGPEGWRIAVGYELISRLGWEWDTGVQPDPRDELRACEEILDALSGG